MTVDQVKQLTGGERLHYTGANAKAAANSCMAKRVIRVRLNGAVKTWKRDAGRVKVPFKYGLYEHGYITEANCSDFHLESDCPFR